MDQLPAVTAICWCGPSCSKANNYFYIYISLTITVFQISEVSGQKPGKVSYITWQIARKICNYLVEAVEIGPYWYPALKTYLEPWIIIIWQWYFNNNYYQKCSYLPQLFEGPVCALHKVQPVELKEIETNNTITYFDNFRYNIFINLKLNVSWHRFAWSCSEQPGYQCWSSLTNTRFYWTHSRMVILSIIVL